MIYNRLTFFYVKINQLQTNTLNILQQQHADPDNRNILVQLRKGDIVKNYQIDDVTNLLL